MIVNKNYQDPSLMVQVTIDTGKITRITTDVNKLHCNKETKQIHTQSRLTLAEICSVKQEQFRF